MSIGTTLRASFLLPGAAILVSLWWLVTAVSETTNTDPLKGATKWILSANFASLQGIAFIILFTILAYCVGIVAVMALYRWPTKGHIAATRKQRLDALRRLNSFEPSSDDPPIAHLLHRIFGRRPDMITEAAMPPKAAPDDAEGKLLQDLLKFGENTAWQEATGFAPTMIEYRRATRQICTGLVPAVVVATAAAELKLAFARVGSARTLLLFLCPLVGLLVVAVLVMTARYQEEVAQSLLVDTAFLVYLRNINRRIDGNVAGRSQPRAHRPCGSEGDAAGEVYASPSLPEVPGGESPRVLWRLD